MSTPDPTKPRRKPTQSRSRVTVEALLEATAQVLVREGYGRSSTNRIARRAGVSIGTLYQYFPNKDALIMALVERLADRQLALLQAQLEASRDAPLEEAIGQLLEALSQTKRVQPKLQQALFEQVPRTGAMDLVQVWMGRATAVIAEALRAREDVLRPADPELAAYIIVRAFHGVVHSTTLYAPERLREGALWDELRTLVLGYLKPDLAVAQEEPSPGPPQP